MKHSYKKHRELLAILIPNICTRDLLAAEKQSPIAGLLEHGSHLARTFLYSTSFKIACGTKFGIVMLVYGKDERRGDLFF